MSVSKTTPMLDQYLSIKEDFKDVILFYRMGDFYEMFFEDAIVASKALEIALTSRNKKEKQPVPMCGVPVRAVDNYLAKMIEKGFKVAICEQVEDAGLTQGIVKREVVRVVTPGMVIDNTMLDEKKNNYILSFFVSPMSVGLAYLDISTATFQVTESGDKNSIIDEILRISPSEILVCESLKNTPLFEEILATGFSEKAITFLNDNLFNHTKSKEKLIAQFATRSLEGFGCEQLKYGVAAAGAILDYVNKTQKQKTEHITGIKTYALDNFMTIDDLSRKNLEIAANLRTGDRQGSLVSIIDNTVTAMGARQFGRWIGYPLVNKEEIGMRLNAVAEAKDKIGERKSIRQRLKDIYDLERLGSKICMGRANAKDMTALKNSLLNIPILIPFFHKFESRLLKNIDMSEKLRKMTELIDKAISEDAPPALNEGGLINKGYDPKLDELISISSESKKWLAKLEAKERRATGINSLKVGYNRVFGYYIEVSKIHSEKIPAYYVRKQTLVNAERYITEELKTFETRVLTAHEERAALEYEIFLQIKDEIIENNTEIQKIAKFLAVADTLLSFAETADLRNYTRPEITTDGKIDIRDGRHPVVERMLKTERFVPNSINLDNTENQILVITGPNMAGKSTVLRQTALIVMMAHIGSFVPASYASISITDRIFTRVGALDNLAAGQSTFMVEMEETANILHNATVKSLIIVDEIGRGTGTLDGLAIAWAVAEYLHDYKSSGVKTLFATHYHELTDLALTKPRVKNFNIAVKEFNEEIIFLRKLVAGGTNRSYGIEVARLAGIPDKVIRRAKTILSDITEGKSVLHDIKTSPVNYENKVEKKEGYFKIINKLQETDITNLTPVEALNRLNEICNEALFIK